MASTHKGTNPGLTPRSQKVGRLYRNGQTIALLHQPKRGKHTRHQTGEAIPILLAVRVSRDIGR